ncbi:early endosome antigen 1-like [Temnothorax curvispinosus]|uniref:Early endosome antigen 1-like n=1 Tax=Temnothorax curvispinosus TaxID=300111 RepID=A0A6J1QZK9_9HYME|nr:early endosome antigen 1-like [Temnothorax curvispinosus]
MDSDYYSTVYTWFEKCGIVSDIRTHLRQNLVNALKRKDLRLCKSREAKSAKQYVYDMLIAEYLFGHNYSFTLSIFASEVPLLVNFCNSAPQRTADDGDRGGGSGHNKLQSDYITHTLETLGIDPNRPEGQYIISNYMNSEAPLLLSILSSIASLVVNAQSSTRRSTCDRETQADLALEANLADATKMRAIRKKIMQQKQLYDDELKTKESKLKQQATVIKYQLNSLNAKVEEAQNVMQSLTLKEKQLKEKKESNAQCILQKEMELSMKQNFLTQEANRLQRERDSYRKFEGGLKKLQRELVKMQKEVSQGTADQCAQNNLRDIHVQTDTENRTIMDECRTLQRQKLELTNLVEEQRSKIEQITQRSAQLSRQLEEVRLFQPIEMPISVARIVSANAIVSESSSTEDILQDAKMRLKRLEEESSKADQYFCNFVSTSS